MSYPLHQFRYAAIAFSALLMLAGCRASSGPAEEMPTYQLGAGVIPSDELRRLALKTDVASTDTSATVRNFRVGRVGSLVHVNWETLDEESNLGYMVQRSADKLHWTSLEYMPANADGKGHAYGYEDENEGLAYYRLAQLGSKHLAFSPLRYSVPAPPPETFALRHQAHGTVLVLGAVAGQPVEVLNSAGELVQTVEGEHFSTQQLSPGMYAVRQGQQVARLQVH